ncbi:hypothetical protein EC957_010635 [Mortierella hygrophila]|uniref:Uncharacterized protein n=1 Tax=Mortierella hygrophila TaxID=979708 RepID=A0A9P6FAI0_9FUNG|nr:hypothetical protein EC957_010635 [Mortierella hygrophila]
MDTSGHPPVMPSSASSSSVSSSDAPGGSFAPRSVSTSSLSQLSHSSSSQQHSPQYSHTPSSSFSIQQHQQQQQQRPPIPPGHHQPRLHHSVSAGNIAMVAQSGRYGGGSSGVSGVSGFGGGSGGLVGTSAMNAGAIAPPKKKDPYATAWRTYSKIAEELQLLNPDGSLYPISKEAILKYLHHQSKRIKSSNLHWYVNGLKKHQENLGFPWDDVRYDEQVVGLLKELTLHPVMMGESNGGGGDDEHHGYGSNRQRQASSGMYPLGAGVGSVSGLHARTPSTQDLVGASGGIHQGRTATAGGIQQQQYSQQQQQPLSHALRSEPMAGGAHVSSALSKRKRDDFAFKKRRMPSSMSMEGDDHDESDLQDDDFKDDDDDDLDARRGNGHHNHRGHHHDPDDSDEAEDSNRYQPLKRRASTGTLLNQARACAVKHVPGPFAIDGEHTQGSTTDPQTASATSGGGTPPPHRTLHHRVSSSGLSGAADRHHNLQSHRSYQNLRHHHQSSNNGQHHSQRQHHLRSPSPELRETTTSSRRHQRQHSSTLAESSDSQRADPPAAGAATPTPTTGAQTPIKTSGKTTVQFSDVVQCASQLQAMYGLRCKDHPWGCVEITEDRHLELTMKMYLDWAGLVASERLTMDELPDLPDFRDIHSRPSVGGLPGGGTLKRMASTPLSSSLSSITTRGHSGGIESSRPIVTTVTRGESDASEEDDDEATTPTRTTTASYFGPYRSPTSSSPQSHTTTATTLAHEKDTPTSDEGPSEEGLVDHHRTRMSTASPPPQTILRPTSAMALRSRPSSPDGGCTSPSAGPTEERSMMIARAKKMPSTPSLRQQHHDHQYMDDHQHYRHDSARPRHSQPSPPLPGSPSGPSSASVAALRGHLHSGSTVSDDLLSDEEDEEPEANEGDDEEEDNDVDVNHYALSPWATAPAFVLADARLRGSRNMGPTARRPNITPAPAGLSVGGSNSEEDTEMKAESRPRDRTADGDKADSLTTTPMVLDPESSVLQIGDLASHRHTFLTPKGRGNDGVDEPVEVATHDLDSMIIGGRHRHHAGSSSEEEVAAMDVDEDMEGRVGGGSKKEVAEVSPLQQQREQALKEVDGRNLQEQEKGLELSTATTATVVSSLSQSQNRNHHLQHPN